MAAGFGGVVSICWMITSKLHRKSVLTFFFGGGGAFIKNVAVKFSITKSIYEWPFIFTAFIAIFTFLSRF